MNIIDTDVTYLKLFRAVRATYIFIILFVQISLKLCSLCNIVQFQTNNNCINLNQPSFRKLVLHQYTLSLGNSSSQKSQKQLTIKKIQIQVKWTPKWGIQAQKHNIDSYRDYSFWNSILKLVSFSLVCCVHIHIIIFFIPRINIILLSHLIFLYSRSMAVTGSDLYRFW